MFSLTEEILHKFPTPYKELACLHISKQCVPGVSQELGIKLVVVMRGCLNS